MAGMLYAIQLGTLLDCATWCHVHAKHWEKGFWHAALVIFLWSFFSWDLLHQQLLWDAIDRNLYILTTMNFRSLLTSHVKCIGSRDQRIQCDELGLVAECVLVVQMNDLGRWKACGSDFWRFVTRRPRAVAMHAMDVAAVKGLMA